MTEFWLTINPKIGEILLGRVGQDDPFIAYREEYNIRPMNYLGYRSSVNFIGFFKFMGIMDVGCKLHN